MSGTGQTGQREVAYRLLATEYEDADRSYSESDEERAPNYVVSPSGARINRLFVAGVLTEVEQVSEDVLRARVVDPTGAFVLYAGQYQPDEMAFLERAQVPAFVAVTGKARTFQPEDSQQVYTSVRPESINEVDARTRDRWLVQAAEHTLDRIGHVAEALARDERGDDLSRTLADHGASEGLAAGIPIALDHYGTSPAYLAALRNAAIDVARVVAGSQDEVSPLEVRPDEPGDVAVDDLQELRASTGDQSGTQPESGSDSGTDHLTEQATDDDTAGADESGSIQQSTPETTADASSGETTIDSDQADPIDAGEGTTSAGGESGGDSLGDFDPEYDIGAETREQVEDEYGTEFQTGAEVGDPGEADIQTEAEVNKLIESEERMQESGRKETATDAGSGSTAEAEPEGGDESGAAEPEQAADEQPEDLQAAVVDLMHELDDGTGADKSTLLDEMAQRHGTDTEAVENAIQDALMDGQCYEPDETTLKPI